MPSTWHSSQVQPCMVEAGAALLGAAGVPGAGVAGAVLVGAAGVAGAVLVGAAGVPAGGPAMIGIGVAGAQEWQVLEQVKPSLGQEWQVLEQVKPSLGQESLAM